jgi:predicted metal-binding protein
MSVECFFCGGNPVASQTLSNFADLAPTSIFVCKACMKKYEGDQKQIRSAYLEEKKGFSSSQSE